MKEDDMRVTDLIPWKHARGSEPAVRGERDPVAMLQNDVNRAVADFLRPLGMPLSRWPASLAANGSTPYRRAGGNRRPAGVGRSAARRRDPPPPGPRRRAPRPAS